ncbi:hypothetical protein Sjap_016515 [Stephania japonica]|uniref:Transmembrane protein n=1 Tax=Stephania japonica TaxID=461633 RepID=A0AAP0IL73_9MAGN
MVVQTTSRRFADRKVERFERNITKRGAVPETTSKKGSDYPVGPVLLGFFVFVVVGSCKRPFPYIPNNPVGNKRRRGLRTYTLQSSMVVEAMSCDLCYIIHG